MALTKVLVTGGLGFVGSAIVRALVEKHPQCSIVVLDINTPPEITSGPAQVRYVRADISSLAVITKAISEAKPQVVIHSAGIVPDLNERYRRRLEKQILKVNVNGTRHVLKAAEEARCQAFVYTSSCCAIIDDMSQSYPNIDERWPVSPTSSVYGESKVLAEAIVLEADGRKISTCVLRPAVIFGEGDTQLLPPNHACIGKRETPYVIGDGMNLWDTVYVGNVADAHVLAAENLVSSKTAAGEVFFIQNNEPVTFREFQLQVWKNFGHYPPFEISIPKGLGWFLGLLAEWVTWAAGSTTTLSRGSVLDACAVRYASGEKARRVLGYEPRVGLEEGLQRSCKEYGHRLQLNQERRSSGVVITGLNGPNEQGFLDASPS